MDFYNELEAGLADNDPFFLWDQTVTIHDTETVSEHRWYNRRRAIVQKGDELYGVEWNEGATEMQEDTELEGEIYSVEAVQVTATKYVRL